MSIDTLIVVGTAFPAALMGLMGYAVTTRPPSQKTRWRYEATFAVLALASVGFVIWGGVRNNNAASKLEGNISGLRNQIKRIAESQGLPEGQSAKDLANAIIARFSELQSKVDDAESKIAVVQHPPQDSMKIYQNETAVASVQKGRISEDGKNVFFDLLSDAHNMNFDNTFSFRSMDLSCQRQPEASGIEMTVHGPLLSTRHDVACSIIKSD